MKLKTIEITLCEACLGGQGGECHTPGCALYLHHLDTIKIAPEVYRVVREWDDEDGEYPGGYGNEADSKAAMGTY